MTSLSEVHVRPGVSRAPFGTLPSGETVEAITLTNPGGMRATLISYGAAIQSVLAPDRDGALADVALGHATLAPYLAQPQFFGATVGRVANRIAGGRFQLDGRSNRVPCTDGPNALHGGEAGFDKVNWSVRALGDARHPSVTFAHTSPDGDQGFPGTLDVSATYTLDEGGALRVEYTATTDRPTLVNLSNHAYWKFPRRHQRWQSGPVLSDGRCHRARAAGISRHPQPARIRIDQARS